MDTSQTHKINFITNNIGIFHIYVYIPCGSIHEVKGIRGISHLLEHLVMNHTMNYDSSELYKKLTGIGGINNAVTSKDVTYYFIKTHYHNYKTAIELMHQMIHYPKFTNDDLQKERKIVLEEMAQGKDDVERQLIAAATTTVFPDKNEYSYEVIGTHQDIKNIKLKDIENYHKKHYHKYIAVVNAEESIIEDVKYMMERLFGKNIEIPQVYEQIKSSYFNVRENGSIKLINEDSTQRSTIITFPSYSIDRIYENIIVNFIRFVLTNSGLNSLLFKRLRLDEQLVYSVNSHHEDGLGIGLYKISFSSTSEDYIHVVRTVLDVLVDFSSNGLGPSQLQYYKKSYINKMKYVFSDEGMKELWYSNNIFYQTYMEIDKFLTFVNSIRNSDLLKISQVLFDMKKMGIVSSGKYEPMNNSLQNFKNLKNSYLRT